MKYITIIGSRQTPADVLEKMRSIAKYCASLGVVVRSGKAGGADAAAIYGCMDAKKAGKLNAKPEMYIPWAGFGSSDMSREWDSIQGDNPEAVKIAMDVHPAWERCSQGAKKLHTRNVCQILGEDLQTKSDLVVYWCKESMFGEPTGGTATAVNLAKRSGIATVNMLSQDWKAACQKAFK